MPAFHRPSRGCDEPAGADEVQAAQRTSSKGYPAAGQHSRAERSAARVAVKRGAMAGAFVRFDAEASH